MKSHHKETSIHKIFPLMQTIAIICIFFTLISLCGCNQKINYSDYISELRYNILIGKNQEKTLIVRGIKREIPYCADGVKRTMSEFTEFELKGKADKKYTISFNLNGEKYQGDFSFDNSRLVFYYSCSINIQNLKELEVEIKEDNNLEKFTVKSVLTPNCFSSDKILNKLVISEKELFNNMTDKHGFMGEIYMRLIYEEAPYYYIGIIGKDKSIRAYLLDCTTGKILAKRITR